MIDRQAIQRRWDELRDKAPALVDELRRIVEPATTGDPMRPLT